MIKQFNWDAAAWCIVHALARRTNYVLQIGKPTPRTTNKIQQIQTILQQENKFIPSPAALCLLHLPCHQFQRAINPHLPSPCSTQYILTSSVRIIAVHIWSQDPAQKRTSKHPKHPSFLSFEFWIGISLHLHWGCGSSKARHIFFDNSLDWLKGKFTFENHRFDDQQPGSLSDGLLMSCTHCWALPGPCPGSSFLSSPQHGGNPWFPREHDS